MKTTGEFGWELDAVRWGLDYFLSHIIISNFIVTVHSNLTYVFNQQDSINKIECDAGEMESVQIVRNNVRYRLDCIMFQGIFTSWGIVLPQHVVLFLDRNRILAKSSDIMPPL